MIVSVYAHLCVFVCFPERFGDRETEPHTERDRHSEREGE